MKTTCLLSATLIFILSSCAKPPRHDYVKIAAGYTEARFETLGKLSFEKAKNRVIATAHPIGGLQACIVEWPPSAPHYQTIDITKTYRFEFLEATIQREGSSRDWVDKTLLRIRDGNSLIFDRSICELHSIPMNRKVEDVVSQEDYIPFEHYFLNNTPRRSPNDGKRYDPCGSGLRHLTWRCPTCYQISENWRKKYLRQ